MNKLKSIYKKASKNVFNAITYFLNAIIYLKNKKFNLISQNIHIKKIHFTQQMIKKHRYLLFFLTKSKKENDKKNNNNFFLLTYKMRAQ